MTVGRAASSLLAMWSLVSLPHCGGAQKGPPPTPEKQTAAQEVLRIGSVWTNVKPENGILSPPSKISTFNNSRKSELTLSETSATEHLTLVESLELRDGSQVECRTEVEHALAMRWGRREGEAALELVRPPLNLSRSCTGLHPNGPVVEPSRRVLFVLRSDNLVAVEPLLDQRSYAPSGPQ